jgi:hypothetical protein
MISGDVRKGVEHKVKITFRPQRASSAYALDCPEELKTGSVAYRAARLARIGQKIGTDNSFSFSTFSKRDYPSLLPVG